MRHLWLPALLAALLLPGPLRAQQPSPTFYLAPFSQFGATVTLSASTSSSRVQLGWVGATGSAPQTAIVRNSGSVDVYVALGDSSVAATTSSTLIPAGAAPALALNGASYIAAITASSTSTLTIQSGNGSASNGIGGGGGFGPFMNTTASNATQPDARKNINTGIINVTDFGAIADTIRENCPVTSTAGSAAITIGSPCTFKSSDAGKDIVLYLENASVATSPLATTISSAASNGNLTLGANAGQTLAGSFVGTTHGTTTIDGIASTVGLVIGQMLSGTDLAAGQVITAVAANSVTISSNASGSHSGITIATGTWVTWGTDNATALSNAVTQATAQSINGQTGYLYFPPVPSTTNVAQGYGVSTLSLAPNAYPLCIVGAGRFASKVIELAAETNFVTGASSYREGFCLKDINFDGNMLATNVGNIQYAPTGYMSNVRFANPAPGGTALLAGSSGNIQGLQAHFLYVQDESDAGTAQLYTAAAQYPATLLDIEASDPHFPYLQAEGQVATQVALIGSGVSNISFSHPHLFGNTTTGTTGFKINGSEADISDLQYDFGSGQTTAVDLNGTINHISRGHFNTVGASSVGIVNEANKNRNTITGFDCAWSTPSNCIVQNYPAGSGTLVYGNPNSTIAPAYSQVVNASPSCASCSTGGSVFMGLNKTITPLTSGFLDIYTSLNVANNTLNDGATIQIAIGTGTIPTNGQACSTGGGTTVLATSSAMKYTAAVANTTNHLSGDTHPSGLTLGTAYWVDLCVIPITGGTITLSNTDLKAVESSLRQ